MNEYIDFFRGDVVKVDVKKCLVYWRFYLKFLVKINFLM